MIAAESKSVSQFHVLDRGVAQLGRALGSGPRGSQVQVLSPRDVQLRRPEGRRFDDARQMMFSRFDQAARAVVTLAEQECRNASHYYLGTEHLLLSMAIVTPGDVAERFHRDGVEPWQVKWACRASMEPASDHPWEGVIVTPRVRRVFELATSKKADNAFVTPLDLLDAMVEDGGGVGARVLASLTSISSPAPTAAARTAS